MEAILLTYNINVIFSVKISYVKEQINDKEIREINNIKNTKNIYHV